MNLYIRLIVTFLRGLRAPRIQPLDPVSSTFRVMPWDIDLFGHMNNGRYLQIMDVSRFAWMQRSRAVELMRRHGWGALLGGTLMRYQRALKPFHSYRVVTRLLTWDSRWLYFEHRFERPDGQLVAIGHARAALRKDRKWIAPEGPISVIDPNLVVPPQPPVVRAWNEADALLAPPMPRKVGGDEAHTASQEAGEPSLESAWVRSS